jgi:cell wall-associated NlpC family hydrolase
MRHAHHRDGPSQGCSRVGAGGRRCHRHAGVESAQPSRRRPRLHRDLPATALRRLGSPAQLRSVEYQAGRFYDALLAVPNWQTLPLTVAAQTVQRSAHPDAYARWTSDAVALVSQLSAVGSHDGPAAPLSLNGVGCFDVAAGDLAAEGAGGLPTGFTLPADTPPSAARAIAWALAQVGTPYSYGGDCTAPHSGDPRRQAVRLQQPHPDGLPSCGYCPAEDHR